MKTLEDIKARALVGVRLELVKYEINGIAQPNKYRHVARTVATVGKTYITLNTVKENGEVVESYLYWPRAKAVSFPAPDCFEFHEEDLTMGYRFL